MLKESAISGLDDTQRKCCGFISLSSFINPPDPARPPYKGFHPFQLFVIFPIHAAPWSILAAKLKDSPHSFFQHGTMFSCTGKVAGFLDHRLLSHGTGISAGDHIFIVAPDSWTFHEKSAPGPHPQPAPASKTSPIKGTYGQPSISRSSFLTPTKKASQKSGPSSPTTPLNQSIPSKRKCPPLTSPPSRNYSPSSPQSPPTPTEESLQTSPLPSHLHCNETPIHKRNAQKKK